MSRKEIYAIPPLPERETVPFLDAAEAWFWFIQAQQARNDGARFVAGMGLVPRPCEPSDILAVLGRLHRSRRLLMDHLMVLRHYGRRQMPPDPRRVKEVRACKLWKEAMERLEPALVRKGIIRKQTLTTPVPNRFWSHGATVHEGRVSL